MYVKVFPLQYNFFIGISYENELYKLKAISTRVISVKFASVSILEAATKITRGAGNFYLAPSLNSVWKVKQFYDR